MIVEEKIDKYLTEAGLSDNVSFAAGIRQISINMKKAIDQNNKIAALFAFKVATALIAENPTKWKIVYDAIQVPSPIDGSATTTVGIA